jgi:hypothetical protein
MRYIIIIFLLVIQLDSFGQFRPERIKKIGPNADKVDTVDIFKFSQEQFFKERAIFQLDKQKVRLVYEQVYDNPCCVDDESTSNLVMTFDNWDALELNKDYNVTDLKASYEIIAFLGPEYDKPIGRIRLIKKTRKTLTINLDITVQSTSKKILDIFKGERVFKRSK